MSDRKHQPEDNSQTLPDTNPQQQQQQQQDPQEPSATPQQTPTDDTQQAPPQNTTKPMSSLLNKIPNMAPEGPLGTDKKGPLSIVGDPLGQGLNYGLKPLGHVTGAIGNPHGEALDRVRRVAEHEGVGVGEPKYSEQDNGKSDAELPGGERIGGKAQTGENPLGL